MLYQAEKWILGRQAKAQHFLDRMECKELTGAQAQSLIQPFTLADVWVAMKKIKRGKIQGLDGLPSKLWAAGATVILDQWLTLFNEIWRGDRHHVHGTSQSL